MSIDSFSEHFGDLHDPRQSAKVVYPLFDVLFLIVCAVIAGSEGWEDIEDFGEAHLEWFQSKGLLLQGLPVHDTIARIVSRLDPEAFQTCFCRWMESVSERVDGELIAIDGKVLRSSYNREDRQSTIHMVSAFSTANGVVLGQLKTHSKSNEINAIPELLKLLDIKGCLISIDAIGCQKEIAKSIIAHGGDYLLAVKNNQPKLADAIRKAFVDPLKTTNVAIEHGHGRLEAREYYVLKIEDDLEPFSSWPNLRSIGVAVGYRIDSKGKESLDYRYYISSLVLEKQHFAESVRGHWGIENCLHWVLDVSLREDSCPIYRGDAAENLACVRHMAVNMLRAESSKKASIKRKQKMAAMNSHYLEKVIEAGFSVMGKS